MIDRSRKSNRMRRSHSGFTLIEIVIVVVIVGILTTIALPAYQDSVRKGQRADAKAGLFAVAGRMEQFILDRGTYTYDMQDLGYDADPMISDEEHYSIDAAACTGGSTATCYVLTATPQTTSPLADDAQCTTLVLSYTGAKTATGTYQDGCWN
jgi:type IV pilus assembly protein PilE